MGLFENVLKRNIELYRYLIAKATFYKHIKYRLVESFLDSNGIFSSQHKNKEKILSHYLNNVPKTPLTISKRICVY